MATRTLYPSIAPSLDLNFAGSKTLDPRITFSRASAATYYDGKTVAKAEENLLAYSQEFGNAVWSKNAASVVDNAVVAPDGSVTADKLVESDTNSVHTIQRANVLTVGQQHVFSIYVKAAGRSYAFFADSAANGISVNLTNGTIATVVGSVSNASAVEAPAGSGWWRVSFAFIAFGTFLNLYVAQDAVWANRFYQGDGTSGIYLWGAQLEQRSQVTAYTPTTTQPITNYIQVLQTALAGVPRFDHNPVTGESLGLLVEEQRTNLLTYSEQFGNAAFAKVSASVQDNVVAAPDGTITADKMIESVGVSTHFVTISTTLSAGGTYTLSVYAKAAGKNVISLQLVNGTAGTNCFFDLASGTNTANNTFGGYGGSVGTPTITHVGNGWYRCSTTVTIDSTATQSIRIGTIAGNGDGFSGIYIWGAQLEAGSFPTSYIKTEASQVTRAADSASMTGANFSSWYRQDEGTIYAEAIAAPGADATFNSQGLVAVSDGTLNNRLRVVRAGGQVLQWQSVSGGAPAFNTTGGAVANSANVKAAIAYKTNDFAGYSGGASQVTASSGLAPAAQNQLHIGDQPGGVIKWGGTLRKIAYYPKRLTNAQLQALTL